MRVCAISPGSLTVRGPPWMAPYPQGTMAERTKLLLLEEFPEGKA